MQGDSTRLLRCAGFPALGQQFYLQEESVQVLPGGVPA